MSGAITRGPVSEFLRGIGLLGQGLRLYLQAPRVLLLGLIPVAITAALFVAAFVVLGVFLSDLAALVTWFADDWATDYRTLVRVTAAIAILGVALLLAVLTFTAVALAIGEPFYERISDLVERGCGDDVTDAETGFWRSFWSGVADSARVVALSMVIGLGLFLAGFVPVLGQTVVPVIGALVGGWFLAVELVGIPFSRRGLRVRDRWRALRVHRPRALGFGLAVFLCFLLPGGAVLMMPAAVAGGTLLARHSLGLPAQYQPPPAPPGGVNPPRTTA